MKKYFSLGIIVVILIIAGVIVVTASGQLGRQKADQDNSGQQQNGNQDNTLDLTPASGKADISKLDCAKIVRITDLQIIFGTSLAAPEIPITASPEYFVEATEGMSSHCRISVKLPVRATAVSGGVEFTEYKTLYFGNVNVEDKSYYETKKSVRQQMLSQSGGTLTENNDISGKTLKYINEGWPNYPDIKEYEATFFAGKNSQYAVTVYLTTMNLVGRKDYVFPLAFSREMSYANVKELSGRVRNAPSSF